MNTFIKDKENFPIEFVPCRSEIMYQSAGLMAPLIEVIEPLVINKHIVGSQIYNTNESELM